MSGIKHFQENKRVQALVLGVGLLLLGAKFTGWWLTNSNAILTDALESIINVVAGFFALFSLYMAALPQDSNHPYGHGKVEFLSSGFEGALIFLAGISILIKSIYNLFYPQTIQSMDVGILLVAGPGLVNFIMGKILIRTGRKNQSIILEADGKHLQSDAYSSIGLVAGLILVWLTGITWIDNVTALIFGGFILYTGFNLIKMSVAGIMDEADILLLKELIEKLDANRRENWIDVHNLRVIKYGSTLHVDCHMSVPYYFNVREAHHEVKALEDKLKELSEVPMEFFIHTDPCHPPMSCSICTKKDCPVREAEATQVITWRLEHVLQNKQHHKHFIINT